MELQELLLESNVDMKKIREKLEEMAGLQVELKIKAIENQSKIKGVLNNEQLEKLSLSFPIQKFGREGFKFKRGMIGKRWLPFNTRQSLSMFK